jgi:hypothetical protein
MFLPVAQKFFGCLSAAQKSEKACNSFGRAVDAPAALSVYQMS